MRTFRKGQRVCWNDPAGETSGEYTVIDPKNEYNKDFTKDDIADIDERMIVIGNGTSDAEVHASELEILFPVSDEDRQQLDKLEQHADMQKREMLELMRKIVSLFDDGSLSVTGHSVRINDENNETCCAYEFFTDEGTLYVSLDYDSGESRRIPVESLRVEEVFKAFCLLIKHAYPQQK